MRIRTRSIILIILAALLLWEVGPYLRVRTSLHLTLHEGDAIFQISHLPYSKQGKFIRIATLSPVSHCGIIVMRDGKPYVLETLKTLRLTPLDQFVKRGWKGLYWIKRPWRSLKDKKVAYKKYLGLPYDSAFKLDNGIYYCSELIWEVYEQQFGIKLCRPRPVRSLWTLSISRKTRAEMKRRGISMKQKVVTPEDVCRSWKWRWL